MKRAMMLLPAAVLALSLTACGKKDDDAPKQAAGGELLPRSASDDMLPYDTLQSQPSLAAPDAVLDEGDEPVRHRRTEASPAAEDDSTAPATSPTPSPTAE